MNTLDTLQARPAPIDLDGMIKGHQRSGALEGAFYTSDGVFAADMRRIFGRWWLFAGHALTIPSPGDYFTWQIGNDPIVVLRDQAGKVRAFFNTCRHRGSRICSAETGHAKHLVCPYHSWTYDLSGKLLLNTKKDFGVDRETLSLHSLHVRDVAGLIFVSLAADPPSFDEAFATISRKLAPHGIDRAKIAHTIDYVVKANWKIIFENNRECYHCPSNHKEYMISTYDVLRDQARTDPARQTELEAITARANARFRALGLDEGDASSVMTGAFFRCHRTPVREGFVTQAFDEKPLCALPMGDFREHNVGTLRTTVFPNFWQHSNSDYAAAARLTPLAPGVTAVRATWLVHADAVEGRDYTLDRLLPVWSVTNDQDWVICENQQIGVSSSRYRPGPFSQTKEPNVAHFLDWYLREVAKPS
jgi:glycine betaine catabolism A